MWSIWYFRKLLIIYLQVLLVFINIKFTCLILARNATYVLVYKGANNKCTWKQENLVYLWSFKNGLCQYSLLYQRIKHYFCLSVCRANELLLINNPKFPGCKSAEGGPARGAGCAAGLLSPACSRGELWAALCRAQGLCSGLWAHRALLTLRV